MPQIPTGNDTKIRIRCSEDTKDAWGRVCASIDPQKSQEEILQVFIEHFRGNPRKFGGERL